MYKFLVVEDEQYARKGILRILSELNNGNIYEADNGASALRCIEHENIDAIITDIQMPVMDGIELIKELERRGDHITVAVISGHDEFSYVQVAIEYAVIDYVLKPFDREAIVKLYYKILRKLKAKETMEQEIEELYLNSNRIRPFIKQRVIMDLIDGNMDYNDIKEMRNYLNLNLGNDPLRLCLVEVDDKQSIVCTDPSRAKLCLYNTLETIVKLVNDWRYTDCFELTSNMVLLVWSDPKGTEHLDTFIANIELMSNEVNSLYGVILNIAISGMIENALKIQEAYPEVRSLLKYKMVYGSGQVFQYDNMVKHKRGDGVPINPSQVIEAIWRNEPEKAQLALCEVFESIDHIATANNIASINLFYQKLLVDCLSIVDRECNALRDLDNYMGVNCLDWHVSENSRTEVQAFFRRLITAVCGMLFDERINAQRSVISNAKQIISERYNTAINVGILAKELNFSKNYFGQLFKTETGMSVGEFINLYRIQKAKGLIDEKRYKMYEIAEMVGFSDQQYFSKIFRKVVGCMPSEYRR